jgi:DNA-binding response OmpR family regulator
MANMKILLAEDDQHISMIARMALESFGGHQVEVVGDGRSALQRALSQSFDLIVLDEMMPHLNGLSVCKEFQDRVISPCPVIFLSAKSQDSDIAEFERVGQGFIAKPFDPGKLCVLIDQIINRLQEAA